MALCAAGALAGLVMVIDGCLPGRAHLPVGIALGAIAVAVLLELMVFLAGLEAGFGWVRSQGDRVFAALPTWAQITWWVTVAAGGVGGVVVLTTGVDPVRILPGVFAFVINLGVVAHAYAVRHPIPRPDDDDEYWIPPEPPTYGPSWRSR